MEIAGSSNRRRVTRGSLAVLGAVALAGGLTGGLVARELPRRDVRETRTDGIPVTDAGAPADRGLGAERLYATASPGVVVITATEEQSVPATLLTPSFRQEVRSLGSGFVLDRDGDIATNAHVVAGATSVRVGFGGGRTYPAKVVGVDPATDLGVVRAHAPAGAFHPLALGDSDRVRVGEPVYALGNPFGLERTLTAGIVSATGRDIQAPDGGAIGGAIQTDAAINAGNSGGPLLDRNGTVIGINAQIADEGGGGNVGIGFAIPSDTARSVLPRLISSGSILHAWLGVAVQSVDPNLARTLTGVPRRGALVTAVAPGSPAQAAGLVAGTDEVTVRGTSTVVGGDAILTLDRTTVDSARALASAVASRRPADRVTLRVWRSGAVRVVTATLGQAPA